MLGDFDEHISDALVWQGVLDVSLLSDAAVAAGHRLADAAKEGDWSTVLHLLDADSPRTMVNQWRPGGPAWYTVLHQAAWHGAPTTVVAELIDRGALRSVRNRNGHNAFGIASRRAAKEAALLSGHGTTYPMALGELLRAPDSPIDAKRTQALDARLTQLMDGRLSTWPSLVCRNLREVLRYPPVEILHEVPGQHVWFPIPGMYGGFHISLRRGYLEVTSWSRVVGGSGQAHVITHVGTALVDEGFV